MELQWFSFVGAESAGGAGRGEGGGWARAPICSLPAEACVTLNWADEEMQTFHPLGIHRVEPSLLPSSLLAPVFPPQPLLPPEPRSLIRAALLFPL